MSRPLRQNPCQSRCDWHPSGRVQGGQAVFHCLGCQSEWVRSEPWTPVNVDGEVSPDVARERARG